MADKSIEQLEEAKQVYVADLFVLEQGGTAKKLTGQTLKEWLLALADGHGGIKKIEKLTSSGLKDTYQITLADGEIFKFDVTNGRSITSITQTSESGLTREYTIAFNDNSSQTFEVKDGRSITGISKTGTSGLVDTYTISYNNGTTSNFTVTNGAKGNKGDNTYTWIKYASQEPTEESHSIGDIPDAWRGEYNGPLAEAPTDWKQYKWYKIKGEQGNTGENATLLSRAVEYQTSDSGTIIPSGAWSTSVPVVAQGKYMWTRTTLTFNSGNPVVAYSVSRMGLDGAGSVSSVNDVSPDSVGNVSLTAEDVGALPSSGGGMTGGIDMNGQPISGLNSPSGESEAATKGYVDNITYTYTQANTLANLTSGEKLTTSLGKIMKAIADLIAHLTNYENPHKVSANQLKSGTLSSSRLPTVPISKGGTGATTAAEARSNLGTMSIVAIYGVTVTFANGKVTYSNSAIKSTSVCIVQRRSGTAGAATTSMFATTSGDGAVTIVTDNTALTTANLNIVIINP